MNINRTVLGLGALAGAGWLGVCAARRLRANSRCGLARNMRRRESLAPRALSGSTWNIFAGKRSSQDERSLAGKVVLITGGSRGFGLALAEEFGGHGARVVLTARDANELGRAREKLLSPGIGLRDRDVRALPCDLADYEQTEKMIALATGEFGKIDILVNNAGIITVGPVENQSLAAFKSAIESNYYTMLHATLAVLPQMLARRSGRIVNITSIGGKLSVPHLLPYSASKFAALGFSQGLHAELRGKGIRVTSVCPGLMRTGSHRQALFAGDREREYRWFSLSASMPVVSTSAKSAAKKVVRATIDGSTEITITPQALLAATFAQALPAITAGLMHLANSLLLPGPTAEGSRSLVAGRDVRGREVSPLMILGKIAARRYNQMP